MDATGWWATLFVDSGCWRQNHIGRAAADPMTVNVDFGASWLEPLA